MSASFRITGLSLGCLLGGLSWCLAVEGLLGGKTDQLLEIRSLSVNGKPVSLHPGKKLRMSPAPRNVAFGFGTATNLPRAPLRVRYKLDGFEDNWREVSSDLSISFRFIDANQDPVSENAFRAAGQTEGWTGALDTSAFLHRRETILVPPGAKGLWVSVSSAGPPNTVGMYAITNLVVTRLPTNNQPSACSFFTTSAFFSGSTSASKSMPSFAATAAAVVWLSPVTISTLMPSFFSC